MVDGHHADHIEDIVQHEAILVAQDDLQSSTYYVQPVTKRNSTWVVPMFSRSVHRGQKVWSQKKNPHMQILPCIAHWRRVAKYVSPQPQDVAQNQIGGPKVVENHYIPNCKGTLYIFNPSPTSESFLNSALFNSSLVQGLQCIVYGATGLTKRGYASHYQLQIRWPPRKKRAHGQGLELVISPRDNWVLFFGAKSTSCAEAIQGS